MKRFAASRRAAGARTRGCATQNRAVLQGLPAPPRPRLIEQNSPRQVFDPRMRLARSDVDPALRAAERYTFRRQTDHRRPTTPSARPRTCRPHQPPETHAIAAGNVAAVAIGISAQRLRMIEITGTVSPLLHASAQAHSPSRGAGRDLPAVHKVLGGILRAHRATIARRFPTTHARDQTLCAFRLDNAHATLRDGHVGPIYRGRTRPTPPPPRSGPGEQMFAPPSATRSPSRSSRRG